MIVKKRKISIRKCSEAQTLINFKALMFSYTVNWMCVLGYFYLIDFKPENDLCRTECGWRIN